MHLNCLQDKNVCVENTLEFNKVLEEEWLERQEERRNIVSYLCYKFTQRSRRNLNLQYNLIYSIVFQLTYVVLNPNHPKGVKPPVNYLKKFFNENLDI
jgi:hypothetical protein